MLQLRRNSAVWQLGWNHSLSRVWESDSLTLCLVSFVFCLFPEWHSATRYDGIWHVLCITLSLSAISPLVTQGWTPPAPLGSCCHLCVSKSHTSCTVWGALSRPCFDCVALVVKHTVMPIPKWCLFLALISQQDLSPPNATPLINKVNKRYMYRTQDPDL